MLQLATVQMILNALNNTINGGLYGVNKAYVPAVSILIGCIVKFILNTILISNPNINVYGAEISSFVCQLIAFIISFTILKKNLNVNIKFTKNILKPVIATGIMGLSAFLIYRLCECIIPLSISTIISIIIAVLVYAVCIFTMRILNEEEIKMMPFGDKLYEKLVKFKIYKENT